MTDAEAAAIAARAEAATPGPWVVYEGDDYEVTDTHEPAGFVWSPAWSDEDPEYEEQYPFTRHAADAAFIAHARADIPALLAERAALVEMVKRLMVCADDLAELSTWYSANNGQATQAQGERAQKALDEARALLGEGEEQEPIV